MVGARWSPVSALLVLSNRLQDSRSPSMVSFDNSHLSGIARLERGSILAVETEDVGNRPRVVQRLDGEYWDFDELMVVLCEHALPLLTWMGCDAFLGWRIDLNVGYFHEILNEKSVVVLFGVDICLVQEDS